jgi:hypothetical protein
MQAQVERCNVTADRGTDRRTTVKYLLMMHVPAGTGAYEIFNWPAEDIEGHMEHLRRLNREIVEAGEWVEVQGLTPPGEAKLVRAGKNGEPITDGPFPEGKEFLAGYWIVDVDTPQRAYEIAAKASAAPGRGGAPLNMAIEVRRVMGGAPSAED